MSAPARTDDEAAVTSRPAAPSDESALVRAVQAGELSAFDQLVRAYMRRAFAVAFRVLGHREDAEDLVQDVFLVALEQIHTFDASRPFGPWFFRILVNRGLNARKSRARRRTEAIPPDAATGSQHSAIAALERGEIRTRFEAALKALPERQQLVATALGSRRLLRSRDRQHARYFAGHHPVVFASGSPRTTLGARTTVRGRHA